MGDRRDVITRLGAVTIRPGREEDAPAYRELRLEALRNHPEAFSSDYETALAKPIDYWEKRLRLYDPDNEVMLYFAAHGQQLVGMGGITHTGAPKQKHSAYIVSMYVRPEWRGQGVAEALIDTCLEWGREQGIAIVKLGVSTVNTPAIRCYARCGFEVYGTEPQAIYHDGVFYDELLMARAI